MFDTFIDARPTHRAGSLSASILLHVLLIAVLALIKLYDASRFEFMPVVHAASVELNPPIRTEHVVLRQSPLNSQARTERAFSGAVHKDGPLQPPDGELRRSPAALDSNIIAPTENIDPGSFTFLPAVLASASHGPTPDPVIGEPVPPETIPERRPDPPQVQLPILITRVSPVYPEVARMARIQGPVEIDAMVNEEGRIKDITVTAGHPLLVDAAIACVKQWLYEPARVNGHVIPAPIKIVVRFQLKFR
jgi:protein TonB